MNKSFNLLCTLCLFAVSFNTLKAQNIELNDTSLKGSEFKFPPLEAVIDSAFKHSAMLKFRKNHIGVTESTLASERIYWTRNLGIQADTRYGNLSNFAMNDDGATNTAALTISRQFNYSVGVYLKFPVFDVLNRKNQIKLALLEVDEAKSMADFTKEEIGQTVIRLYQDLILEQKLLQT